MKIIFHDQEDYDLFLEASEQFHNHVFDSENPVANLIAHMYRVNTEDDNCEEERAALSKMIVIDSAVPKVWRPIPDDLDVSDDLDLELVKEQTIEGWDQECGWNPTVALYEGGKVLISFPEFPPDRLEDVASYDEVLSENFGCDVYWEDRELFWLDPKDKKPEELFLSVVAFFTSQVE